jgi:DNA polymerase-3 subunit delta
VFFKRQAAFAGQMRAWRGAELARALGALNAAEAACKSTGVPAETVCAQALTALAVQARPRPQDGRRSGHRSAG